MAIFSNTFSGNPKSVTKEKKTVVSSSIKSRKASVTTIADDDFDDHVHLNRK